MQKLTKKQAEECQQAFIDFIGYDNYIRLQKEGKLIKDEDMYINEIFPIDYSIFSKKK